MANRVQARQVVMTADDVVAFQEQAVQDAVAAQRRLERVRLLVSRVQEARDASVRFAGALGDRKALAAALGISRPVLYEILNRPADHDREWLQLIEEAHVEAWARWDASGRKGEPDDYWPLPL